MLSVKVITHWNGTQTYAGAMGVGKLPKHLWLCKKNVICGRDMKEIVKPQMETEGFWLSLGILLCILLKEKGDQTWAGDSLLVRLAPIEQGGAKGDIYQDWGFVSVLKQQLTHSDSLRCLPRHFSQEEKSGCLLELKGAEDGFCHIC